MTFQKAVFLLLFVNEKQDRVGEISGAVSRDNEDWLSWV
jgi:hypothetical protein